MKGKILFVLILIGSCCFGVLLAKMDNARVHQIVQEAPKDWATERLVTLDALCPNGSFSGKMTKDSLEFKCDRPNVGIFKLAKPASSPQLRTAVVPRYNANNHVVAEANASPGAID